MAKYIDTELNNPEWEEDDDQNYMDEEIDMEENFFEDEPEPLHYYDNEDDFDFEV